MDVFHHALTVYKPPCWPVCFPGLYSSHSPNEANPRLPCTCLLHALPFTTCLQCSQVPLGVNPMTEPDKQLECSTMPSGLSQEALTYLPKVYTSVERWSESLALFTSCNIATGMRQGDAIVIQGMMLVKTQLRAITGWLIDCFSLGLPHGRGAKIYRWVATNSGFLCHKISTIAPKWFPKPLVKIPKQNPPSWWVIFYHASMLSEDHWVPSLKTHKRSQ